MIADSNPTNPIQLYLQQQIHYLIYCSMGIQRREVVVQCNIMLDLQIMPYLQQSSFLGVAQIRFIQSDCDLILPL